MSNKDPLYQCSKFCQGPNLTYCEEHVAEAINQASQQAAEEAVKGLYPKWEVDAEKRDSFKEGAEQMREKAAKVAEACWDTHPVDQPCHAYKIRDQIRALPISGKND